MWYVQEAVPSLHFLTANNDVAGLEGLYQGAGRKGGEGVDSNERDWRGQSPLDVAAIWNAHETIKLLVEKGEAQLDAQNPDGLTALHRAALWGHVESAKELLESGCGINTRTKNTKFLNGETPEEMARRYNMNAVVEAIQLADKERKEKEAADAAELLNPTKPTKRGSKAR
jgi:hypothetical protein